MANYNFSLIDKQHNPLFGNYYLSENDSNIIGLMLVSSIDHQLYLVKFFDLEKTSQDVTSYFKDSLNGSNADFDWISTKLLLNFLDQLLKKDLVLKPMSQVSEFFNSDPNQALIGKIELANFNQVGFVKEFSHEDKLEMVSKLLIRNQETKSFDDEVFIADLADSQVYLLDTLFDNE